MPKNYLETTPTFKEIANDIADLTTKKQGEYGDSFGKIGDILRVLYPKGIKPEQYDDMAGVVRVLDKVSRISQGDKGEESAWQDIMGYGLLGTRKKLNQEEYLKQYRAYFGEPKAEIDDYSVNMKDPDPYLD